MNSRKKIKKQRLTNLVITDISKNPLEHLQPLCREHLESGGPVWCGVGRWEPCVVFVGEGAGGEARAAEGWV